MKKFSLLVVAACAAFLGTSCTSTGRGHQTANVPGVVYGDVNINQIRQEEIRKKSPGNSMQAASQRRDEITLVGGAPAPMTRRSSGYRSGSSSSGYRSTSSSGYRSSQPVPTGRYVSGYHVERVNNGAHVTIPPDWVPIGGGVIRHGHGQGVAPDGSREGVIIEQWGYQGPHVPWQGSSSSSTTVNRFGY